MEALIIIFLCVLGFIYILYLHIQESKQKIIKDTFVAERERFFNNMNTFGIDHRDIKDQYKDIKDYSELVKINDEMETHIKKYNL
jgi:hypothetical protein